VRIGADALCRRLAQAAGSTKTFHAYLSTQGPNRGECTRPRRHWAMVERSDIAGLNPPLAPPGREILKTDK
jgi:hypothetical protein